MPITAHQITDYRARIAAGNFTSIDVLALLGEIEMLQEERHALAQCETEDEAKRKARILLIVKLLRLIGMNRSHTGPQVLAFIRETMDQNKKFEVVCRENEELRQLAKHGPETVTQMQIYFHVGYAEGRRLADLRHAKLQGCAT